VNRITPVSKVGQFSNKEFGGTMKYGKERTDAFLPLWIIFILLLLIVLAAFLFMPNMNIWPRMDVPKLVVPNERATLEEALRVFQTLDVLGTKDAQFTPEP
jgi:hypothetical protein